MRHIILFGAGSVAQGLASCIQKSNSGRVSFITREPTLSALSDGIKRTGIFGEHISPPSSFDVFHSLDECDASADVILVCSKAFDAEVILESILQSKFASLDTPIILCHNGWGTADIFAAKLDKKRIFNARIITGFRRPALNHVDITVHADDIHIGSIFYPETHTHFDWLADAITKGGMGTITTPKVSADMWSKMLYNCCLNPLGAMLKATYGELADSIFSRTIMDKVMDEIYEVMRAYRFQTHWPDAAGFRDAFYSKMIPPTAAHRSSMLQDITAGRKTEIDFLSGRVVDLAKAKNIAVPTNALLADTVRFLEKKPT
ncbi:MAG: 2-dehydropantoate 2-reductase [Alphaproteobacteria bacterium]|nr:2-dehydropantoate 2-reductase [Alphaproteobacteria bacterium]